MSQVAVGNLIYSYEKLGDKGETPILILHGWGRSKEEWLRMGKQLSKDREVYVLDLPGFGGSTLPYQIKNMKEYAKLIVNFCSYLKINQVIILGHSLGGRVGILLAQPNSGIEIKKLILVDPAGVKNFSIKRVVLLFLSKIFGLVPRRWRRKCVRKWMDDDYQKAGDKEELYRIIVGMDLRKKLNTIKPSTLLIWGEKDSLLPLSQTKIYRSKVKDIEVRVIWGARHDPHITHFDQLLNIVQEGVE